MMYKRFLKIVTVLTLGIMCLCACGKKEVTPKTGPTITIGPSVSVSPTPAYEFDFSETEIDECINKAYENMKKLPSVYEFDASKDYKAEKSEYSDGSSDVTVYDEQDRQVELRMYDDKSHLYKAFTEYYLESGEKSYGAVYDEGKLSSYYETVEYNGKFRIEIVIGEEGIYAKYLGKDAKEVKVSINE